MCYSAFLYIVVSGKWHHIGARANDKKAAEGWRDSTEGKAFALQDATQV